MGEKLFYIRVSGKEQNIERQLIKASELGVEERFIFIDKASGKDFNRVRYQAMREVARKGDLIYLDALDRLGRNYDLIIQEWKYFTRELGVDIVVLENESLFDSRKFKQMGDMGKLMEDQFLSLLSYVASTEREKLLRRQKEGISAAKAAGKVKFGRPSINLKTISKEQRKILKEQYPRWINKEITAVYFSRLLDLKKNTFYKIAKEYEEELSNKAKIEK
ncbi:recombinase family protein [Mesobacillus maritimus]|uniref:recombinase family protein n=1 Tax=Mesobacillus maritimus TaxID=1643336 RepID=UPI00384F166A